MKILVTGGAGFVGGHLVDALVERGHSVRVLDALIDQVHGGQLPAHFNRDAEFVRGDVCDPDVVAKALDGVEAVFHEAAEVGVAQSMYEIVRYVRTNELGTATLLQEMIRRPGQFRKLIVASSNTIYGEGTCECEACGERVDPSIRPEEQLIAGDWEFSCELCGGRMRPVGTSEKKPLYPTTIYAINKQNQEQSCIAVGRAYGIPTVALRYFNIYGTRQSLSNPYTGVCSIFSTRLLSDKPPIIFEDGGQTRDLTHVSDIVQANLLALESDKADLESVNVGTGRATSIRQIAEIIARGLGKGIEPEIVGKYRAGDIRHCVADISKGRERLGYEPKVKLEDGLAELLEWVRGQEIHDRAEAASAELAAYNLVK